MEDAFEWVLIAAVIAGVLIAILTLRASRGLYDGIGRGSFSLDEPDRPRGPAPESAAGRAEAQAEIRQMVEAKAARREARGQAPLDVEAEIAELSGGGGGSPRDEALRDEVRQLVIASNERRVRRGQEPLDVGAEVDRQLRDLA